MTWLESMPRQLTSEALPETAPPPAATLNSHAEISWHGKQSCSGKQMNRSGEKLALHASVPHANISTGLTTQSGKEVRCHNEYHDLGQRTSPKTAGVFQLLLDFTEEYPNKPPNVRFATKMFHPNSTACLCCRYTLRAKLALQSTWMGKFAWTSYRTSGLRFMMWPPC